MEVGETFNLNDIKSKDMLLRLKKEGPYETKIVTKITKKDIEKAIAFDENKIKELEESLSPIKVELIEKVNAKYEKIKDTDEWLELSNACKKVALLNEIKKRIVDYCDDKELHDELCKIVENKYINEYYNIISHNKYKDFYFQRETLNRSREYYCLAIIKDIKKSINDLEDYCRENPNIFSKRKWEVSIFRNFTK